jgi:pseudouridine-5'-phosphate glycosidase
VQENSLLRILPDVSAALASGAPVVALESSVIAQGLPIPGNREAVERMTRAIERRRATPAITAVVRGTPTLGLTRDELERFLRRDGVRKVSARDLGAAVAQRADGATTVAATLALASLGGVRVFATGGIGGVHREPAFDESADLAELARTPMIVVCAGAKSILDLPATLERLETLGVPVIGYRTLEMPGFFTAETGLRLTIRAESVDEIARMYAAHRALGRQSALLVVQPLPLELALPRDRVERAVANAVAQAKAEGIRGAAMTPALLAAVERETNGRSLVTNLELLERNAALAAEIAVALEQVHEEVRSSGLNSASSGWYNS